MSAGTMAPNLWGTARACGHLLMLSLLRQFWTLQSLIAVLLLAMVAALVLLQSLRGWDLDVFGRGIVIGVYLGFLLPILCLCFGTQSLGGDWEERSLVWLLTRPIPRPLIYAVKFLAAVPWTLAMTLGGLGLLGLLAGYDGLRAVRLFWPAVAWGTLAYLSLFVLIGAWFRRSTVVAVVYAFVVETIIGNMPGFMKRASITFYSKCMVYDRDVPGIRVENPGLYLPVEGDTAVRVLALVSLGCFLMGLLVFSRREYNDLT